MTATNPTNLVEQQHVFYRDPDKHILHLVWVPVQNPDDPSDPGKVFLDDWTARTRGALAGGDPVAVAIPGQQHVFYRGEDSRIHHILWVSQRRRLYTDTWSPAGAEPVAGAPAVLFLPGQQHVFYRSVQGTLGHVLWDQRSGLFAADDWTTRSNAGLISGDPSVLSTPGQQHTFSRGVDGGLQHIVYGEASGTFGHDDWLSGDQHAPRVAGNPASIADGEQQHVFYRATDNSIRHVFWSASTGTLSRDNWTALASAKPADDDPIAVLTPDGVQHVFYRASDGGIAHLFWDPATKLVCVDTAIDHDRPPDAAAGRPAAFFTGTQQHVFYRAWDGGIRHVVSDTASGAVGTDDWSYAALAPIAAGSPAAMLTTDPPVAYQWKIVPVGDSLTEGFLYEGGYRVRLFETAVHWGRNITFVGTHSNGPPDKFENVPFPRRNEGWSGKDIKFFLDPVAPTGTSRMTRILHPQTFGAGEDQVPDIMLLMIGTNDILLNELDHARERLDALLTLIFAANVCQLVVLAQIPPLPYYEFQVRRYNDSVADLVRIRAAAGDPIVLADMHTGFDRSLLGPDNKHPNQRGYQHIAAVWFAAIDTSLT